MAAAFTSHQKHLPAAGSALFLDILKDFKKFTLSELREAYDPSVGDHVFVLKDCSTSQALCTITTYTNGMLQMMEGSLQALLVCFAINVNDLMGSSLVCLPAEPTCGRQPYTTSSCDISIGQIHQLTKIVVQSQRSPYSLKLQSVNGHDVVNIFSYNQSLVAVIASVDNDRLSFQFAPTTDTVSKAVVICFGTKLFRSIVDRTLLSQKKQLDRQQGMNHVTYQKSGMGMATCEHSSATAIDINSLSHLGNVLIKKQRTFTSRVSNYGEKIITVNDGRSGEPKLFVKSASNGMIHVKDMSTHQSIFYFNPTFGEAALTNIYASDILIGRKQLAVFYDISNVKVIRVQELTDQSGSIKVFKYYSYAREDEVPHPLAETSVEVDQGGKDAFLQMCTEDLPVYWIAMILVHSIQQVLH